VLICLNQEQEIFLLLLFFDGWILFKAYPEEWPEYAGFG